jgi:hypothetical protein
VVLPHQFQHVVTVEVQRPVGTILLLSTVTLTAHCTVGTLHFVLRAGIADATTLDVGTLSSLQLP